MKDPAVAFALVFLLAGALRATDVIEIEGGDLIRGTVVSGEKNKIVVKTAYAGKIAINLATVAKIRTDSTLTVTLANGDELTGRLEAASPREARVISGPATASQPFALADIRAIYTARARWKGHVEAGGQIQDGTQNVKQGTAGLELTRSSTRHRVTLKTLFNYVETNGVRTTRNGYGSAKYDYVLRKYEHVYVSTEAFADEFQDLSLRLVTGVGMGYRLFRGPRFALLGEGGIAYLVERFDVNAASDDERLTARIAVKADWKIASRVSLSADGLVYPALEFDGRLQARNELFFQLKLTGRWSLRVGHVYTYTSDPAPGFEKDDDLYVLTARFAF